MLQIAICDPNILHRNAFCDTLAKLLFDAADYSFSCFGNAEDLLARQDAAFFQLVFLEIHLDGPMNGLEAADRIRSLSPDTDIIFLTDAAEYVTEGYRYHAFDFLIKPVPLARLQDVVSRYLSERRKRPADFLNVTIQRCSIQLPLYQIYYLESQLRKIIAHTWENTMEFYERLDHLETLLCDSGFVRCHQSYLVNSRHIRQLSTGAIVLADGTKLPVSRTYFKRLKAMPGFETGQREE